MLNASFVIGFLLGAIAGPAVLLAGVLLYARKRVKKMECAPPWVPTRERVTFAWKVFLPDGTEVNLEDRCAGRVVFLNFWASWCRPCVAEMPSIEKLYHHFKDRVAFACISQETARGIGDFAEKNGYTLPVYHLQGQPPAEFRAEGIPATFIVSKEQKVVLKHVGAADWGHEDVIRLVEVLLSSEPEGLFKPSPLL